MAVALADHRRQCQRRHHGHGRADDAGHGGQDRAHDGDAERQGAGYALQQHLDAIEEIVGDPAPLHHHAHEDERRDRHQHEVLRRLPPDARYEIEEFDQPESAQKIADQTEGKRHAAQDECHRVAGEQQRGQRHEHQDRQIILREVEELFAGLEWQARDHHDRRGNETEDQQRPENAAERPATCLFVQCHFENLGDYERPANRPGRDLRPGLWTHFVEDTNQGRLCRLTDTWASVPGLRPRSCTDRGMHRSGRRLS